LPRHDQIDPPAKQRLQPFFEPKIGVERVQRRVAFELDDKIDVAVFRVEIATRRRAENIEPPYVKAAA
jgi:hypothetical protein